MSTSFKRLTQEALCLDPAERAELADFLVESLEASPLDGVQEAWVREANQRLAEIRSGAVKAIPGDEVLAEARRLAQR
jgi:putative addiction module component (TIGR02574 family)